MSRVHITEPLFTLLLGFPFVSSVNLHRCLADRAHLTVLAQHILHKSDDKARH